MTEPISISVSVPLPPERAFECFADLDRWWPRAYTWAGDALERIEIEPREGGHCVEWGPHDFRCDWGRVLVWDPPHHLAFAWQIAPDRTPHPDPAGASRVEVRFGSEGQGTLVTLIHDGFDRHGAGGAEYREGLAAESGWPYMLGEFVAACR